MLCFFNVQVCAVVFIFCSAKFRRMIRMDVMITHVSQVLETRLRLSASIGQTTKHIQVMTLL